MTDHSVTAIPKAKGGSIRLTPDGTIEIAGWQFLHDENAFTIRTVVEAALRTIKAELDADTDPALDAPSHLTGAVDYSTETGWVERAPAANPKED